MLVVELCFDGKLECLLCYGVVYRWYCCFYVEGKSWCGVDGTEHESLDLPVQSLDGFELVGIVSRQVDQPDW